MKKLIAHSSWLIGIFLLFTFCFAAEATVYKPNTSYCKEFTTAQFSTGAAYDATGTPVATANKNGTDDGAFTLTVTKIDTGRYKITGTVPAGYAIGDVVNVSIAATVDGVSGKGIIDTFTVDTSFESDTKTDSAAIKLKTDNLPASPAATGDIPTTGAIADSVWDELIAGHLGAGSTGEKLNAAGALGDPWSVALPGAYGAGTAGKIIGDSSGQFSRALGLMMENHIEDDIVRSSCGKVTSKFYLYNSKANALTHDKATGILATYSVTVTYNASCVMTKLRVVKD